MSRSVPPSIYTEKYYLTINDGGALRSQDNALSPRLQYMAQLADIRPSDVVLDIGSGTGELSFHAAHKGARVYGIDYSKDAIRMCEAKRRRAPKNIRDRITFIHGSATELIRAGIPKRKITKVLMTDVVEHLYPEELKQAMLQLHALINDDATLFIHTAPNLHFYKYGYPIIRFLYPGIRHIHFVRKIIQSKPNWKGKRLPKDPEEGSHNKLGHVNEQTPRILGELLQSTGYKAKIWTVPFLREVNGFQVKALYAAFRIPLLSFAFNSEIVCVARKR